MNKEKIKEVKKLRKDFWHHEKRKEYQLADEVLHTIANHYLDELIEQSERVFELEEEIDRLNGALHYQLTQENIRNEVNRKLIKQNKRYREALELLAKQETLGKDVKTGKTAVSYNGMIALKGLNAFDDDNYIVYGFDEIADEIIENILEG